MSSFTRATGVTLVLMTLGVSFGASARESAGAPAEASAEASASASEARDDVIEILYYWGFEGRYRVDTLGGTLTVDCLPQITGPLTLEQSDREAILAVADSVGFFRLPCAAEPAAWNSRCRQDPCASFLLRIAVPGKAHTVAWSDCNCDPSPERDRAAIVGDFIMCLVTATDAYRQMDESCENRQFYW